MIFPYPLVPLITMTLALNHEADGSELAVSVGETFELRLPENPTTGYRWQVAAESSAAIRVVGDSFQVQGDAVGAPGIRQWRFQTDRSGTHPLVLVEKRSWEKEAVRKFEVTVVVG
jgi:inhibitor of cysteine peptidase